MSRGLGDQKIRNSYLYLLQRRDGVVLDGNGNVVNLEGRVVLTEHTSGSLGGMSVYWFADTTSGSVQGELNPEGDKIFIKDSGGNASNDPIYIYAPAGQTINGNASEAIDVDWGWVEYYRVGSEWKTLAGQGYIPPAPEIPTPEEVGAIPATEKGAANGVATLNSISRIPQTNINQPLITVFDHRLETNREYPNYLYIYNNEIYGISTGGSANGGILRYSLNGVNVMKRGYFPTANGSYNDMIPSMVIVNDIIYSCGNFGNWFSKTSIDGTYLTHISVDPSRIRHIFHINGLILTLVNIDNTNVWVFRYYDYDLQQVGGDISIPYIVTSAGIFDGNLYLGGNNALYEYDFSLTLIRTYTHSFGITTFIPTYKDPIYPTRILTASANRVIQFDRTNGNLLGSYSIASTRGSVVFNTGRGDNHIFILDTGYIVGSMGNNGMFGAFDHNTVAYIGASTNAVLHTDGFIYLSSQNYGVFKIKSIIQ